MADNEENHGDAVTAGRIARYFDGYSDPWRKPYSETDQAWHEYRPIKLREDYAIAWIAGEPKGTAVDLGCGVGHALTRMRRLGFRHVIGVDISRNMLAEAAQLIDSDDMGGAVELHCCDVRDLKVIQSGSVDACTALGVIEYHPEDAPMLKEVNRILKPGAAAVIQTRNFYCINSRTWRVVQKAIPRYRKKIAYREHRPPAFRASLSQYGFSAEAELFSHFYALYPLTAVPVIQKLIGPLDNFFSSLCERFRHKAVSMFVAATYMVKVRKVSECGCPVYETHS